MTHSASAVLVAAALSACIAGPAYGQTVTEPTTPAQTTSPTETTPTETTPTQTTPTPTEATPAPAPANPEETSSTNEYVESVPTGGGQAPSSGTTGAAAPAPAAPAAVPDKTSSGNTRASKRRRAHRRPAARSHRRREHRHDPAPATAPAQRPVPTAAVADAGEPADPLLLGLALLAITAGVLGTAAVKRQGAGA